MQRGHGGDRIGESLPLSDQVPGTVQPHRMPAPGGDPDDRWCELVHGGPPRRRGRIGEVRAQTQRGEREPPGGERDPDRPGAKPQHHRYRQRDRKMAEIDPTCQNVVPADRVRVVEMMLQPHGRQRTTEHGTIQRDHLRHMRGSAIVREPPTNVVDDQQHRHRQPVACETQMLARWQPDVPADGGGPHPAKRGGDVRRQTNGQPPHDERDDQKGERGHPPITRHRPSRNGIDVAPQLDLRRAAGHRRVADSASRSETRTNSKPRRRRP